MSFIRERRKGVVSLPLMPQCRRFGDGLVDGGVNARRVHRVLLRDGVGDEHAAAEAHFELGLEGRGELFRRVDAVVHLESALSRVERRQLLSAVADHGDALGLEIFQREA